MRTVAKATDLEKTLEVFIAALEKGIRVEALILYGSYAKGEPNKWSDFDVAVISPDFEGIPLPKRQEMLADLSHGTDPRIEPIGYASSEYHEPGRHSFLREIIESGRVVYEAPAE